MSFSDSIIFPSQALKSTRDGYGEALLELGQENPDVVVLATDVAASTRCDEFARQFPDRFFQLGISEQNMAGIAAGLSLESKIPFCSGYAIFNPGRNWEQIRTGICYSNLHVIIVGSHAGLSAGSHGATHQGLEDIALTRVLPNMTVLAPADAVQARAATLAAVEHPGPIYLRLSRAETPVFYHQSSPFKIGQAEVLKEGTDVTLVACGPLVYSAIEAAEPAQISVEVINMSTIKPLDVPTLLKSVRTTGRVVTVEDHQITGGLGGAVAEILSQELPVPVKRIGVLDSFGESGNPVELARKYRLTKADIAKTIKDMVG